MGDTGLEGTEEGGVLSGDGGPGVLTGLIDRDFGGDLVIFPDWVGEIHTAQLQLLDRRQRTRIPKVLL